MTIQQVYVAVGYGAFSASTRRLQPRRNYVQTDDGDPQSLLALGKTPDRHPQLHISMKDIFRPHFAHGWGTKFK